MARRKSADSWIDDAFDDQKMQEEIERAKRSRNAGCLISVVAFVIVAIALVLAGISGIASV